MLENFAATQELIKIYQVDSSVDYSDYLLFLRLIKISCILILFTLEKEGYKSMDSVPRHFDSNLLSAFTS